jgi:large subunit ribosomal protein L43
MQIAVAERPYRHPYVMAWYLKDRPKQLSLKNLSKEQVAERLQFLRDMRPVGLDKWAKAFRTTPSVQGEWSLGQRLDRPHRSIRG